MGQFSSEWNYATWPHAFTITVKYKLYGPRTIKVPEFTKTNLPTGSDVKYFIITLVSPFIRHKPNTKILEAIKPK